MTLLTFLTALALSGVAAYYSVIGLAAIFPGSFWPIIIMGSVLEGAKLVTVSWLYRNWKEAHIGIRIYLTAASVILMLITSMGIFGYLSKAHLEHSADTAPLAAKVQLLDEKIRVAKGNLDDNRKIIKQMDDMVDQTMGRSSDEKGVANSVVIRRSQQKERSRIQAENEAYQKTISQLTEEKFPLQNELQKVESDFGPIKYVAELVYGSGEADIIDKAVRLVIMLIMVVFDPLAVLLLIAANMSMAEKKPVRNKVWDDFMKGQPTELVREPEHVGIIAQEVANVVPEIVVTDEETGNVSISHAEMFDLIMQANKELQEKISRKYLHEPFIHFKNLKPMPYIPEKVEEVTLTEEETKHNTIEIEKENVIVLDEITGETMPAITSKRLEPKYDYDEPYSFREKENK
jgi:hypothetical protein